jgi:hypothetical protein
VCSVNLGLAVGVFSEFRPVGVFSGFRTGCWCVQ